jgi:hypothetical protein
MAEMVHHGYDKDPKAMHFDHTDANGVVYQTTGSRRQPLKGEYYLVPAGVKGQWIVKQAQNDFAKQYRTIVTVKSDSSEKSDKTA